MTTDEMMAFAQSVLDGGKYTRADILKFFRAFVTPEVDWPTAMQSKLIAECVDGMPEQESPPPLGFEIEKTDTGIHVPREANRSYSRREAAALIASINKALK
jgi:hypothetical protein